MTSPFPGMNPYFEQSAYWLDFHTELLTTLRRLLVPQVGPAKRVFARYTWGSTPRNSQAVHTEARAVFTGRA